MSITQIIIPLVWSEQRTPKDVEHIVLQLCRQGLLKMLYWNDLSNYLLRVYNVVLSVSCYYINRIVCLIFLALIRKSDISCRKKHLFYAISVELWCTALYVYSLYTSNTSWCITERCGLHIITLLMKNKLQCWNILWLSKKVYLDFYWLDITVYYLVSFEFYWEVFYSASHTYSYILFTVCWCYFNFNISVNNTRL